VYYAQKRLSVCQRNIRKRKGDCWLAGGFDVDFDLVLSAGSEDGHAACGSYGEDGHAACGSYVLHRYSARTLDVYGQVLA